MSAISDFAARVQTHNDKINSAVTSLTADVAALNDQIARLQGSPGAITAEDQELLDGIEAKNKAIAERLAALDDITPPVAPKV